VDTVSVRATRTCLAHPASAAVSTTAATAPDTVAALFVPAFPIAVSTSRIRRVPAFPDTCSDARRHPRVPLIRRLKNNFAA
jgi:hypothetical protein